MALEAIIFLEMRNLTNTMRLTNIPPKSKHLKLQLEIA